MKILVDACVAGSVAPALCEAGHVVESVTDWPADPGGAAVLAHAATTEQIVLTLDKDFGGLAIVRRLPHAGIIRLVDCAAAQQGSGPWLSSPRTQTISVKVRSSPQKPAGPVYA